MQVVQDWQDYELIDAGNGEKVERWGTVTLRRPDSQVLWPIRQEDQMWKSTDGHYHRNSSGGGHWDYKRKLPERWTIQYRDLKFHIRPTNFKHTGLFPEQAANWNWMSDLIEKRVKSGKTVRVLNLFAYTGGATIACAKAGAELCHVDAAKGMVQWARENAEINALDQHPIRWIVDDVFKFVQRELRRGRTYDGILMDPPSYGRGTNGELWKLEDHLAGFLNECSKLLSDEPLFMLLNSYTSGISPTVLKNLLAYSIPQPLQQQGIFSSGEIGLPIQRSGMVLPAGIFGRWEASAP